MTSSETHASTRRLGTLLGRRGLEGGGGGGGVVKVGIHAHNDAGLAVANSLAAVRGGATVVQGTVNGVGERCGNADLCAVVGALALKSDRVLAAPTTTRRSSPPDQPDDGPRTRVSCDVVDLTALSRFVDETLNRAHDDARPYVGASAFAHKGGLHVAAVAKDSRAYEHVDPRAVGNAQRVLVSELSGRANIWSALERSGLLSADASGAPSGGGEGLDADQANTADAWRERARAILDRVKRLEALGYSFEGAEASVHLLLLHASPGYCRPFRVLDYEVTCADDDLASVARRQASSVPRASAVSTKATARATVKVALANADPALDVAEGNGPVAGLFAALQRALAPTYAVLNDVKIADYKVRILDPKSASRAATRVMISFRNVDTGETWTTVGVDRNIISASANALVDGFEYAVIEHADFCMLCEVTGDEADEGTLLEGGHTHSGQELVVDVSKKHETALAR
mmetsp:Transcript_5756/g.23964  ORF Transcript_5756/g.23964 Transcript_5756/m.23964 type:complete len:461 (+) Transcript_5756:645-2027(+)